MLYFKYNPVLTLHGANDSIGLTGNAPRCHHIESAGIKMNHQAQFWLIVGSQNLYGKEVLETVDARGREMAAAISASGHLPFPLVYKGTMKSADEITATFKEANYDDRCLGIISWSHTFSPSKMWIGGFALLQKPYCHFATQYNKEIPNEAIDMDFMNLNQAAHGDREHSFITSRMGIRKKIIAGYWQDAAVQQRLGEWMRAAYGVHVSRNLKVLRFGDNMRQVAVTEGDKVEAQIRLGWQVNTWPVGDLVQYIQAVGETEIDALMALYEQQYRLCTDNLESVRYQARLEIAMRKFLEDKGCHAFTDTFEDLHGMEQLPGLATQRLMAEGYGFGGEGDWKTAAMCHIMKQMARGKTLGTSFMEDYTYHFTTGEDGLVLGSHMLEICPSLAEGEARVEVHPLGIGGKKDPARLVFEGRAGEAIAVSLVDMGGRMRLICQDLDCVKPIMDMPNLPVARVMWRMQPSLAVGLEAWLRAGGAHHTVLSFDLKAEQMRDFARMLDIEFVHLSKDTRLEQLEKDLFIMDLAWKLR